MNDDPLLTGLDPEDPLVRLPKTLNPYRGAVSLLFGRLRWDIRPESWRSRARIRGWQNLHLGRRAVILCNGPSLLKADFSRLDSVFTFGLNKINLLFDKVAFRPSCIVAVNPFVIEQNADFFNTTDLPLFLDSKACAAIRQRDNVAFMHATASEGFARDCAVSIFQGYTVTYVAMQLAFHMGFKDVALVGCDHNFSAPGPANKVVVSGETDMSHFDPKYFAGGVQWQLPDLFESEVAYRRARNVYEAFGRRIVNCTEGGKLDSFPRLGLGEFLRGES